MEKFIVADYLDKFSCKYGDCRTCCIESPQDISKSDYCKVLAAECSQQTSELDSCFDLSTNSSQESSANHFNNNNAKDCPMEGVGGRCMLKKELGVNALHKLSNMYPRNFKSGILVKGGCANSCERVLELLFESPYKLSFHQTDLAISGDKYIKPKLSDFCKNIQNNIIQTLQNRKYTLESRIDKLGIYLKNFENGVNIELNYDKLLEVSLKLENLSSNFKKYSTIARKNYGISDNCYNVKTLIDSNYDKFFVHFEKTLPLWEIYLEKLLVNHLFFIRFPYTHSSEELWESYLSFIGIYALTKVISVGFMADKTKFEDFIDCIVGLYRCFEQSDAEFIIKNSMFRLEKEKVYNN